MKLQFSKLESSMALMLMQKAIMSLSVASVNEGLKSCDAFIAEINSRPNDILNEIELVEVADTLKVSINGNEIGRYDTKI
jgi:hypothetical protein